MLQKCTSFYSNKIFRNSGLISTLLAQSLTTERVKGKRIPMYRYRTEKCKNVYLSSRRFSSPKISKFHKFINFEILNLLLN